MVDQEQSDDIWEYFEEVPMSWGEKLEVAFGQYLELWDRHLKLRSQIMFILDNRSTYKDVKADIESLLNKKEE